MKKFYFILFNLFFIPNFASSGLSQPTDENTNLSLIGKKLSIACAFTTNPQHSIFDAPSLIVLYLTRMQLDKEMKQKINTIEKAKEEYKNSINSKFDRKILDLTKEDNDFLTTEFIKQINKAKGCLKSHQNSYDGKFLPPLSFEDGSGEANDFEWLYQLGHIDEESYLQLVTTEMGSSTSFALPQGFQNGTPNNLKKDTENTQKTCSGSWNSSNGQNILTINDATTSSKSAPHPFFQAANFQLEENRGKGRKKRRQHKKKQPEGHRLGSENPNSNEEKSIQERRAAFLAGLQSKRPEDKNPPSQEE
ncbi:MAG: hypothetical protein OXE99_03530 [Cellvibrionales bacterium]|nr:hypothetical protein [Cellvibrionales bacterium]